MSEDKDSFASNEDHDGIREYDNPLPFWWLATFFATIIFGFHYWLHYQVGGGLTQREELKRDMDRIQASRPPPSKQNYSEEELTKLQGNAAIAKEGHDIFASKCAACHGPQLQGLIGPNLVDDYWIHGQGKLSDIADIVRSGVPEKGMPTWGDMMKDEEIKAVAIYVFSQHGTTPPNPKPPQGEKVVHN